MISEVVSHDSHDYWQSPLSSDHMYIYTHIFPLIISEISIFQNFLITRISNFQFCSVTSPWNSPCCHFSIGIGLRENRWFPVKIFPKPIHFSLHGSTINHYYITTISGISGDNSAMVNFSWTSWRGFHKTSKTKIDPSGKPRDAAASPSGAAQGLWGPQGQDQPDLYSAWKDVGFPPWETDGFCWENHLQMVGFSSTNHGDSLGFPEMGVPLYRWMVYKGTSY